MRVAVFGPTGGTGQRVVRAALDLGHEVTTLARRPEAVPGGGKATVLGGDVLRAADVRATVAGADAVVSALGIGMTRAATIVYSEGTSNIIQAMREEGISRLVCVSSAALESAPGTPFALRLLHRQLQRILARPFADQWEMERMVGASDLDWTVVRAARLTNGPRRGSYRTASGRKAGRAMSISRADLADYLLTCLDVPSTQRRVIEIAY
jgi:putative NADH-flavin reductase